MVAVTVVIPNYNGIKYLDGLFESLLLQRQEVSETQILVIDNFSTDGSRERLMEEWPEVDKIFLDENTGFCHAVNVGIKEAKGEYVILLNNDTRVLPDFIKNLYTSISSKEDAFSVSSKMLMWDKENLVDDAGDQLNVLGWAYGRGKGRDEKLYDSPCKIFAACGGAAIYRKSVFDKIGLFDELHFAYLEDIDLGYRARINGYHNYFEPAAKVLHFGSASTGSRYNPWKTEKAAENNVYMIIKNMPVLQKILNLPFLMLGYFIKYLFFVKKKMGKLYLKGLMKGLKKGYSKAGRAMRVPFKMSNFSNYLSIQLDLYVNTFKILKKS